MNRDEFETELATELARYYPAGAESIEANLKRMREGDSYADKSVTGAGMAWAAKYAWWAWKQSRAVLVVDLPGGLMLRSEIMPVLEAAGVKVAS